TTETQTTLRRIRGGSSMVQAGGQCKWLILAMVRLKRAGSGDPRPTTVAAMVRFEPKVMEMVACDQQKGGSGDQRPKALGVSQGIAGFCGVLLRGFGNSQRYGRMGVAPRARGFAGKMRKCERQLRTYAGISGIFKVFT